jgi:hypothetical protein
MSDRWFVEVYPAGANKPDAPTYFDDFDQTLEFMKTFKLMGAATDTLRVHTPAKATDQERIILMNYGALST